MARTSGSPTVTPAWMRPWIWRQWLTAGEGQAPGRFHHSQRAAPLDVQRVSRSPARRRVERPVRAESDSNGRFGTAHSQVAPLIRPGGLRFQRPGGPGMPSVGRLRMPMGGAGVMTMLPGAVIGASGTAMELSHPHDADPGQSSATSCFL